MDAFIWMTFLNIVLLIINWKLLMLQLRMWWARNMRPRRYAR